MRTESPRAERRPAIGVRAGSHARRRSYNDDNLQIIPATQNLAKSNTLPPVTELAKLRDVWPSAWGDVLPAEIDCPAKFLRTPWSLRTARPRSQQKIYSKMITDPYYDDDWLRNFDKLFQVA